MALQNPDASRKPSAEITAFKKSVLLYYKKSGRDLPWRHGITPYRIVVSEIMLQQTQAPRVMRKFDPFIKKFPSFAALAKASTLEVLKEWQGLGYNRRGLNLHRLAKIVTEKYGGNLPKTYDELLDLPGIGPNTAGSILAFAFNIPRPFIETNIRSVYIHFFFPEVEKREGRRACKKIKDDQLFPFIEKTLLDKKKSSRMVLRIDGLRRLFEAYFAKSLAPKRASRAAIRIQGIEPTNSAQEF